MRCSTLQWSPRRINDGLFSSVDASGQNGEVNQPAIATRLQIWSLPLQKKRKLPIRVVEWPGHHRRHLQMEVDADQFRRVRNGSRFTAVPRRVAPKNLDGPAWGTITTFSSGNEKIHRLVGPLIWKGNCWQIPMLNFYSDTTAPLSAYREMAEEGVSEFGLAARSSR
jgi:hypothetical protein